MKIWMCVVLAWIVTSGYGQDNYGYCNDVRKSDEPVFLEVDKWPERVSEESDLIKHTRQNLKYAGLDELDAKHITCFVSLIVDQQGKITSACIIEHSKRNGGIDEYDKRALDYARSLEFEPAIKDGKPVRCLLNLAVRIENREIKKANRKKGK